MKVLLVGEDREGSLLRSLEHGLRTSCELSVVDPAGAVTRLVDSEGAVARLRRQVARRDADPCFLEAVEQLCPDITLIVKGRGIRAETIERARASTRIAIYYPDNPLWAFADAADTLARLAATDVVLIWSKRISDVLRSYGIRVEVMPFGYDARWFPLTDPATPRQGVAFVGTWNPRRERYLQALSGLPLVIVGSGWSRARGLHSEPPAYGLSAGSILRSCAIGINIFHPHNAGAHNMRTREIAACGALQLTDPGCDGTPLRDGDGCRWFHSPAHLRELVEEYLGRVHEGCALARRAQDLVGSDTYARRAEQMLDLFADLL